MVFQYLIVVHLVNCVSGRDDYVRLMALLEPVQILVDGIRGSTVPGAVVRGDGRCEDIQAALLSSEIPPLGGVQVLVQGARVILSQYRDSLDMRVRHIAECEVDTAIASCHGHSRYCTLVG